MHLSGLKKLPGHEVLNTDLHLWKKARAGHKTRTEMSCTIYSCPLWHRCKCMKTIRVGPGRRDWILILEGCGLHDAHSHEEDGSKYRKYEQIISLSKAAITVQNLSGSAIRRNMLLHDSLCFLESRRIEPLSHTSPKETGSSEGQTASQRSTGRRGTESN
jgi:hypothetical protein